MSPSQKNDLWGLEGVDFQAKKWQIEGLDFLSISFLPIGQLSTAVKKGRCVGVSFASRAPQSVVQRCQGVVDEIQTRCRNYLPPLLTIYR